MSDGLSTLSALRRSNTLAPRLSNIDASRRIVVFNPDASRLTYVYRYFDELIALSLLVSKMVVIFEAVQFYVIQLLIIPITNEFVFQGFGRQGHPRVHSNVQDVIHAHQFHFRG